MGYFYLPSPACRYDTGNFRLASCLIVIGTAFTVSWEILDACHKTKGGGSTMKIEMVDPRRLMLDKDQPRESLNETSIEEYTARCKVSGMTKPVEVREIPEGMENPENHLYMVVNGAHRTVASVKAALPEIPVIVVEGFSNEGELRLNQMADNFALAHTPGEIMNTVKSAIEGGVTVYQVSQRLGKSVRWVQEMMGIAQAPPAVRDAFKDGKISKQVTLKILEMIQEKTLRNPTKSVEKAVAGGTTVTAQMAALEAYAEEVAKSDAARGQKLFKKDEEDTKTLSKKDKAIICVSNGKNFTYKHAEKFFDQLMKAAEKYAGSPLGNGHKDELITAKSGKITEIKMALQSLKSVEKTITEVLTKYEAHQAVVNG